MSYRSLRYAFLILLSASLLAAGWGLARVNTLPGYAVIPIAVFILIVAVHLVGLDAVNRTREEVIAILRSYLDTTDASYDPRWDDFVSVPIRDPELDAIRRRLLQLESEYSSPTPEDFLRRWQEGLREALRELGAAA